MNILKTTLVGCFFCAAAMFAHADELPKPMQGLYMNSVNQCPQALIDFKKSNVWSGTTIGSNQIQYPDKNFCKIYAVDLNTNPTPIQMYCSKNHGEMVHATLSIDHNMLTILSTSQNQSLYRCADVILKSETNNNSPKKPSGLDLGEGIKLSPKANNNSAGFKMKVPM